MHSSVDSDSSRRGIQQLYSSSDRCWRFFGFEKLQKSLGAVSEPMEPDDRKERVRRHDSDRAIDLILRDIYYLLQHIHSILIIIKANKITRRRR